MEKLYWPYRTARVLSNARDKNGYGIWEDYDPNIHPVEPPYPLRSNHYTFECNDPKGRFCTISDYRISFGDSIYSWGDVGGDWPVEIPRLIEI